MFESENLTASLQNGLGIYYLIVVLMNLGFAGYQFYVRRDQRLGMAGVLLGVVALVHMGAYFAHLNWQLPASFRAFTTDLMGAYGGQAGPILYTALSVAGFL